MIPKIRAILIWVMLACAPCLGVSTYLGLQPGLSTRGEVDRVLGQPVRALSATLFEYNPQSGIRKIYVEFRTGAPVVNQIQVNFLKPISRSAMIRSLKLPENADVSHTNAEGKLVEYFGSLKSLVITYVSSEASSGVISLGYYSRELFESAVSKQNDAGKTFRPQEHPCFAEDPGSGSQAKDVHYNWAQHQDAARLEGNLMYKLDLLFRCPSMSLDRLSSAFANISVIIARYVPDASCFGGDSGVTSTNWLDHKNAFSDRQERSEVLLKNLQWKTAAALKCLDPSRQLSFFADVSVAIAKAPFQ